MVRGIIQRLIGLLGTHPRELRNYLKMLETLSTSRRLERIFQDLEREMLSKIDIEKLPSYPIGMDQGIEQEIERVAMNALRRGMGTREVMDLTGLSEEVIERLRDRL